jgi:hypothetical protein
MAVDCKCVEPLLLVPGYDKFQLWKADDFIHASRRMRYLQEVQNYTLKIASTTHSISDWIAFEMIGPCERHKYREVFQVPAHVIPDEPTAAAAAPASAKRARSESPAEKIEEKKEKAAVTKHGWIALLRPTGLDSTLEALQGRIDEKDLCDDMEVVGREEPDTKEKKLRPLETHPHITAAYNVPEITWKMGTQMRTRMPIPFQLSHVHVFEVRDKEFEDGTKHSFDVLVWKLAPSAELKDLHDYIVTTMGVVDPYPVYSPHLTLAYLKPGAGAKYKEVLADMSDIANKLPAMRFDAISWAKDGDRHAPTIDICFAFM